MTRLPCYAIYALVLLRLLIGWHFYNEGVKKLDPSFSSAGFLRTARGPLAPVFRSLVPGPYGAHRDLARPVELGTRPEEQRLAIEAWTAEYAQRAAAALKDNRPAPSDIDPAVPGADWFENIRAGWEAGGERLAELGVSQERLAQIAELREAKLGEVVQYLHNLQPQIEELQHEEWRLQQLRDEARGATAPYQQERIDAKAAEVWSTMQPWIAAVRLIEQEYLDEAVALAEAPEATPGEVAAALSEQSTLKTIDRIVTIVVLGCGICLFLGAATPVAAIVAAGFLFSLMLTLPPWTATTDREVTGVFFWAIEAAALLVLAALGAGRWAGVDGVMNYLLLGMLGRLPQQQQPAD